MKKPVFCDRFDEGISHLVHAQNFPKNEYFLPTDMYTYQGVRNINFSENFAYVLNE